MPPRAGVTRDRVVEAAVRVADASGAGALTMRALAEALGVAPMSLYHHVPNKEAILDAAVDAVFAEVDLPVVGAPWRAELRRRAVSVRAALVRHPWALALMESRRNPGPATLAHHDAVLGTFRAGGFSLAATAHAYALLDAFVYGFALQEATLAFRDSAGGPGPSGAEGRPDVAAAADGLAEVLGGGAYPHLVEFVGQHALRPGYSFAASFEVGLDLVLDGLERLRAGGAG